ncbi:MAG: cytochrome C, partial [Piscirickettsiaceae bacterium CG_4_9_14_3_um_filter_43_564]
MKKLLLAVTATSLMSFGLAAHAGDVAAGKATFTSVCVACHGEQGQGVVGPKLAGQSAADLSTKLHAYKNGEQ